MKSTTYNAIITKSYGAIESLFFPKNRERASLDKFLKESEFNDFLVISPEKPNFIELDINFPTGERSRYISLRMVDTYELSEFFVLDRHPVDNIIINRLEREESFVSGTPSDFYKKYESRSNKFYLSFGVGDDIRTWSGPYVITLNKANLRLNSDGVKEMELLFTPQLESIRGFTGLLLNDGEYGQLESRFDSKKIKYDKFEVKADIVFESTRAGSQTPKPGYEEYPRPTWNYWVRSLIGKYISNLFPGIPYENILVLFSTDLDSRGDDALIYLKNPANGNMLAQGTNLDRLGITLSPLGDETPVVVNPSSDTQTVLQNLTGDPNATINRSPASYDRGLESPMSVVSARGSRRNPNSLNSLEPSVRDKWRNLQGYGTTIPAVRSTDGIPNDSDSGDPYRVNQDQDTETDKSPDADSEKYKLKMVHTTDPRDQSVQRFETIISPLISFFKGLREQREKTLEFTLFEENDTKILNLLEKHKIIKNSRYPVILFGEKRIINNLIYPSNPFKENPKNQLGEVGFGSALTFIREKEFKKYSEDFYQEFYAVRNRTSSFGEKIDLGPLGGSKKIKPSKEDIIFMHNLKNSNVLDVDFDNAGYLRSLLVMAAESKDVQQAQASRQADVLNDNKIKFEEIIKYIQENIKDKKDENEAVTDADIILALRTDSDFARVVYEASDLNTKLIDWLEIILFIANNDSITSPGPKVLVDPGKRVRAYADMLEDLNRFTITAKIRTLPFFNHGQLYKRKCFLVGLQNNIVGSRASDRPRHSPFTGRYVIIGARHVIASDRAFSEFQLSRTDLTSIEESSFRDYSKLTLGQVIKDFQSQDVQNVIGNAEEVRQQAEQLPAEFARRLLSVLGF